MKLYWIQAIMILIRKFSTASSDRWEACFKTQQIHGLLSLNVYTVSKVDFAELH
jgi:hypothetical protein